MQSLTMLSGIQSSHLETVSVCSQICNTTNDVSDAVHYIFSQTAFIQIMSKFCTLEMPSL